MIVSDFFQAMQAGKELANATTWKNAQLVTSKLTVLVGAGIGIAAFFGYTLPITYDQGVALVSAVGVLVGLFNGSATLVSTTRIGLPPRRDAVQPTGADGGGDAGDAGEYGADARADDPVPYLKDMAQRG